MSGGPGVLRSSSRITWTRADFTAVIFFHFGLLSADSGLARSPVAVHARTMTSGFARATSSSLTWAPAATAGCAPHISMSSATHGGELMRGLDQASEYTIGFATPAFARARDFLRIDSKLRRI